MHIKQSSSSPCLRAPCLHSRTVVVKPWPGFIEKHCIIHTVKPRRHPYLSETLMETTCTVTHSLWVSCEKPVAAEVEMESSEWVPLASYTQKGHWPYQSPAHHPPYSSHSPSIHTGNYRVQRDYLHYLKLQGQISRYFKQQLGKWVVKSLNEWVCREITYFN